MSVGKSKWELTVIPGDATLRDAVNSLNLSGLRIALVVDTSYKLIGTVSDGDIRRGILGDLKLDSPILSAMNSNPVIAHINDSAEKTHHQMLKFNIQQIPVIDEREILCGLRVWGDVPNKPKLRNQMIVMAGGKGARLYPETVNCPKPMLPVNGKPILEHILRRAIESGFENFVFSINYLGEQIESYFGDGSEFGVRISYIRENKPLGTAGSLRQLILDNTLPFLVTNGDVLTDLEYSSFLDFHQYQSTLLSVAVRNFEWQNPFGVIEVNESTISKYTEKPIMSSYINAGVYVFSPEILAHFPQEDRFDMSDLILKLLEDGIRISAYPMHENWLDVGSRDSLAQAMRSPMTGKKHD